MKSTIQNILCEREHGEKVCTLSGINVDSQNPDNYSDGDRDRSIFDIDEKTAARLEKYNPRDEPVGVIETKNGFRFKNY